MLRAVPRPSRRAESVQNPIIPQVADWIRATPGTISLGQGVAGYGPPHEAWAELERMRRHPSLHRYQSVDGMPELTAALATKLERRNGILLNSTRGLMVTAGANAAFLQVILALCDPGDEVILPLPYYFNQHMALTLAHVRPVVVPTDARHHPDIEAIAAAVTPRTKAIVTVSPNNPTGAVYPGELLRQINELCARSNLVHVSDETYEYFVHGTAKHVSPGGFPNAESHTISLFSFSKAFGFASWRVGYMVYPQVFRESLRKIQDTNIICPPVISQCAALGCLRAGDAWIAARLAEVATTRRCVLETLGTLGTLATASPADGAFYVLLKINAALDPVAVTHKLIAEHRVAVIPGTAFGLETGCYLRVAYGALTPETAVEGIQRLVNGLRSILG